ncbi:hypothetical protein V6Z11_A11G245200 [Gossypium hirsutum]
MSYTFFSVRHFPKHGKTLSPRPLPLPLPLGLQISAIARYPTPRPKFLRSCAILKNDDEKVWSRTNARVGVKDVDSTVSARIEALQRGRGEAGLHEYGLRYSNLERGVPGHLLQRAHFLYLQIVLLRARCALYASEPLY